MKKFFLLITIISVFSLSGNGQNTSPYWSLAGNSNASPSSKLGTTNNTSLRFYTNNLQRMIINSAAGFVGIGNPSPVNILTVQSGGSVPLTGWLSGLNSPVFVGFGETVSSELLLAGASNIVSNRAVFQGRRARGTLAAPLVVKRNDYLASLLASGYDGGTFQNPAAVNFYVDATPSAGHVPARISLVTGTNVDDREERLRVGSTGNFNFNNGQIVLQQSNGFTGIGTANPGARLNIISPEYVSLKNPGILMLGDSAAYNIGMDVNVIQARYNGTAATLYLNYYGGYTYLGPSASVQISNTGVLTTTGLVGINGGSNSSYALNVNASASHSGINVTDAVDNYAFNATKSGLLAGVYISKTSTSSVDACIWGNSSGSARGLQGSSATGIGVYGSTNNAASYAGYFGGNVYTTGSYLPSDITLKKNVKDFSKALDIIKQLHPKLYQYKNEGTYKLMNLPQGDRYGLLAEDLEKVLPNLVKQTKFETATDEDRMKGIASPAIDFKAVNYTELIPILLKAMQEQQKQIEENDAEKDKQIIVLQNQINELKSMIVNGNGNAAAINGSSYLKQNVPNPAGSNTIISYYVGDNAGMAQIKITDIKGSLLKIYNASKGNGQLTIRSGELPAGNYNYTLYVNDNLVDTKKMIIAK